MATLNELLEERRKANGSKAPMPAARTERLEPSAFLEEAEGKPVSSIVVGLRTPNDEDYSKALACDDDHAALLAIVSVGICDPNDCRRAHPSFPFPDIQIPKQLKPFTIRYLFDQIELLHLETSPLVPLATDEELFGLGLMLECGDKIAELQERSATSANRVRRLASAILQALDADP